MQSSTIIVQHIHIESFTLCHCHTVIHSVGPLPPSLASSQTIFSMRRPLIQCILLVSFALLVSLCVAIPSTLESEGGITIIFPDPHVGSFHLSYLYPSTDAITADTCIDDITAALAALVDDVVDPSVFLVYADSSHTTQLQENDLLGDRSVLYVDVVHPELTVVEGLSEKKERRLLQVVGKIDAAVVKVVQRGQDDLAIAAKKAEQLVEEAAAQAAVVELLVARVSVLEQLERSDDSLQAAEDAVATAELAASAQESLTYELQSDIVEVQGLLARILHDLAEVSAIVDEAEAELDHRHRRYGRRDTEAAAEQAEFADATLIVRALTEVLELGVKAVAEAQNIVTDGEAAVLLAEAVAQAVEVAKCAIDDAETASRSTPKQHEQDGQADTQNGADATNTAESSTGKDSNAQQGAGNGTGTQ